MFKDRLYGEHIYLAKAKPKDMDAMFKNYWSDKVTAKYMLWEPIETIEQAKAKIDGTLDFQSKNPITYLVYLKENDEAIGMAGFIEIAENIYEECGIGIGSRYVHKGYGKEILGALIDHIFNDLGGTKIIYSAMQENVASRRLAEHFGFKYKYSVAKVRVFDNYHFISDFYELEK